MVIQEKRYTLDEFHAFIELPENKDRLFELIDGVIVRKMASFNPSRIAARLVRLVGNYVDDNNLGYVTGADGSYVLDPDNELIPDAAFIAKASLPQIPEREVYGAPDLAIEVMSPLDRLPELRKKAQKYLHYGTRMVWLVFPEDQRVEVYMPDQDVLDVGFDGTLSGGDVLPGFTLPVRTIFA